MCCKWSQFGWMAAAFGAGVLAASLLPAALLLPLSAVILIAAGLALIC